MEMVLRYRGRVIRESDLAVIRALIEQHPTASRRRLSQELCAIWNWVQPNGATCDMICRGLMLALERAGHITLPPTRSKPVNPLVSRPRPPWIEIDATPIECGLKDLGPLQFRLVRRTSEEPLFNSLIEHHHYLRYTHGVGEQLKYMIFAGQRPVACLGWSSAARHLGPRDRFIGWSREARRRNIRFQIGRATQVHDLRRTTASSVSGMEFSGAALGTARPVYWLEPGSAAAQHPVSDRESNSST